MIYTEITNEDKVALHSGNCAIKTKIIVSPGTEEEVVLTEQNSVKSWEHTEERYVPDVGFIGQFVARELTGELHNISDASSSVFPIKTILIFSFVDLTKFSI